MTLNKVILIGNLGADPEMRYTPNGAAVCEFRMAVSRRYTTAAGEQREETEWFRVTSWNKLAELVNQYLQKGRKAYVEGRISSSAYTDREGQPRASLEVTAETVLFLDPRSGNWEEGALPPDRNAAAPSVSGPAAEGSPPGDVSPETEDVEELPW
ncbi:MAG: single-stranded DNA-binding protein [Chloroflexi bacterium]|nr:single-stranded DNA-binding protein [Chloroflexota bacterium]